MVSPSERMKPTSIQYLPRELSDRIPPETYQSCATKQRENYENWFRISSGILTELGQRMETTNWSRIKYPRILDYQLNQGWHELTHGAPDEFREWQDTEIQERFRKWLKDYPPEVDFRGFPAESYQKVQRSRPAAHRRSVTRNSLTVSRRASPRGSSVGQGGISRATAHRRSRTRSKLWTSGQLPSWAGQRSDESIDGMTTIHFSTEGAEKIWLEADPLLTFLETLQMACLRLRSAAQKNESTRQLEGIQFQRLCQTRCINFANLKQFCRSEFKENKDFQRCTATQSCKTTEVNPRATKKCLKFVFQVDILHFDERTNIPRFRLFRISKCPTFHGPSSAQSQGYMSRLDKLSLCTESTECDILSGVIATMENLMKQFSRLPFQVSSKQPLVISMSNLLRFLKRWSKRNDCSTETLNSNLPNWISYGYDGTLTVNYPSGHPAIIWTPTFTVYKKETKDERHLCSHRSGAKSPGKGKTNRRKAELLPQILVGSEEQSAVAVQVRKSGFFLLVFDLPTVTTFPTQQLASLGHHSKIRFSKNFETEEPKQSCANPLNLLAQRRRLHDFQKRKSLRDSVVHRDTADLDGLSTVETEGTTSGTSDRVSSISESQSEYTGADSSVIGQLLAYYTPSQHGAVFRNQTSAESTDKVQWLNPFQLLFTKDRAYRFLQSGQSAPQFPFEWHHQNTNTWPATLDVQLNKHIRVYCTGSQDFTVTFSVNKRLELKVVCTQKSVSEPEEDRVNSEQRSIDTTLLANLPYLSVHDEHVSYKVTAWRKKRQDAFEKIFKKRSPPEGNVALKKFLEKSRCEIRFICATWLKFLRTQISLSRSLSVSGRAEDGRRARSASRATGYQNSTTQSISTETRRIRRVQTCHALRRQADPTISSFFTELTREKKREVSSSQGIESQKRLVPYVYQRRTPSLERASELSSQAPAFSQKTNSRWDGRSHSKLPTGPTKYRPSPLLHGETSHSVQEARLQWFPVKCPKMLRACIQKLQRLHLYEDTEDCSDNLCKKGTNEISPNAQQTRLINLLSRHQLRLQDITSCGCQCSKTELPLLTDLELDLFLNILARPDQAIVVSVFDSSTNRFSENPTLSFCKRLYTEQHKRIPSAGPFRRKTACQDPRDTHHYAPFCAREILYALGTRSPCGSLTTAFSRYRFLSYDLACVSTANSKRPLLQQRYGPAVRTGSCLIFIGGKLCHLGDSITGYPDKLLSRKLLERKIAECFKQVLGAACARPISQSEGCSE